MTRAGQKPRAPQHTDTFAYMLHTCTLQAKLRREAVANRKKASKLELEMAKLQRLHQHKSLDVSSLRAALKGRDLQLEEAHARNKQLEAALAA